LLLNYTIYFFGEYNEIETKNKSTIRLLIEVLFKTWIIGITAYIERNIFAAIPFPLQGFHGYDHLKVKEVSSGTIFLAFLLIFNENYRNTVKVLVEKLQNKL